MPEMKCASSARVRLSLVCSSHALPWSAWSTWSAVCSRVPRFLLPRIAHRFLPRNSYMYVQYSHPHRTHVDLLSIDRRDARPTHTHRPAARRRIYCLSRRQLHCVCCRCLSSYPPRLGSRQLPSSVAQDSLAAAFADLLLRTVLAAKCYPFPATAESLNGRTGKPGHPR